MRIVSLFLALLVSFMLSCFGFSIHQKKSVLALPSPHVKDMDSSAQEKIDYTDIKPRSNEIPAHLQKRKGGFGSRGGGVVKSKAFGSKGLHFAKARQTRPQLASSTQVSAKKGGLALGQTNAFHRASFSSGSNVHSRTAALNKGAAWHTRPNMDIHRSQYQSWRRPQVPYRVMNDQLHDVARAPMRNSQSYPFYTNAGRPPFPFQRPQWIIATGNRVPVSSTNVIIEKQQTLPNAAIQPSYSDLVTSKDIDVANVIPISSTTASAVPAATSMPETPYPV